MGKKSRDPAKQAALQARKEAKADKAARKRSDHSNEQLDDLIAQYKASDSLSTTRVTALPGFPAPRANATLTLYADQPNEVYLFGGEFYDGIDRYVVNHLLQYNISKNVWKQIDCPKSPLPRCAHSCVYYNHSLYVFGGETAQGDDYYHYKDLWKFHIPTKTWTELPTFQCPSPRSGHATTVYKSYMIVFGGFYEALKDPPRWYNDVHVFNLQTEQWIPISQSRLATNPEPRSAMNHALLGDAQDPYWLVHGGFVKIKGTQANAPESRVYTDAWRLNLNMLLSMVLQTPRPDTPLWTRVLSSSSVNVMGMASPQARAGMASWAYKGRLWALGGVRDKESLNHQLESVFYNDIWQMDQRKWYPVLIKESAVASKKSGKKDKAGDLSDDENDENGGGDDEMDEEEVDKSVAERLAWDINKLRSNMSVYVDGSGNIVHDNMQSGNSKKATSTDDEDEKEEDSDDEEDVRASSSRKQKSKKKSASTSANSNKTTSSEKQAAEVRTEPLPRINAATVLLGNNLILYGGLLEVGDREVTLDDMWSVDLRKRGPWVCMFPGTMHKQVWRGTTDDDDSSHMSASDRVSTRGDSDDDEEEEKEDDDDEEDDEDAIEEEKEDEDDEEEEAPPRKSSSKSKKSRERDEAIDEQLSKLSIKDKILQISQEHNLDDENRTPMPDEDMDAFYQRTQKYWSKQAGKMSESDLSKEEKKEQGYKMAQKRFDELLPVLNHLRQLHAQRKAEKERKRKEKVKDKDS
jgi:Domain of unknown function (DUF4110)/Kelch motif